MTGWPIRSVDTRRDNRGYRFGSSRHLVGRVDPHGIGSAGDDLAAKTGVHGKRTATSVGRRGADLILEVTLVCTTGYAEVAVLALRGVV